MGRSLGQAVKSKPKQQRCQQDDDDNNEQSPSPQPDSPLSIVNQDKTTQQKRKIELDDDASDSLVDARTSTSTQSRPKRRATNAHIIRYLQTRNPIKLEEEDLERALKVSREEQPDFWPAEDTASCSSSDHSNAPSASSNSSSTGGGGGNHLDHRNQQQNATNTTNKKRRSKASAARSKRSSQSSSSAMQQNHQFSNICNCQHTHANNSSNNNINQNNTNSNHPNSNCTLASNNRCPMSTVHNRYKPVTKKNIYSESDFFHDGIMEYIEYELKQRGVLLE